MKDEKRPLRTARRFELVNWAHRVGIKNPDQYTVRELRTYVGAKIARGAL